MLADFPSVRSFPGAGLLSSTAPFRLTYALARNGNGSTCFENSETQLPIGHLTSPDSLELWAGRFQKLIECFQVCINTISTSTIYDGKTF
jgi:hypothetical protein